MSLCDASASHRTVTKRALAGAIAGFGFAFASPFVSPSFAALSSAEINRFDSALSELKDLDAEWDSITTTANVPGDGIRKRLGTVYGPPKCLPALCSFNNYVDKFVQSHADDLDVEVLEGPTAELLEALVQADFLAYSSVFADYGNGGGPGGAKELIDKSREQVKRAEKAMTRVVKALHEAEN